jgi:putative nucleotidyltransferase with HDIG domain
MRAGGQVGAHGVLVVSRDARLCRRIRAALRDAPGVGPVAVVSALEAAGQDGGGRPALTLLDTSSLDAAVAVAEVARVDHLWPGAATVVVASTADPGLVRGLLDAGALSLLLCDAPPEQTRATVLAALDGRGMVDVDVVRPVIDLYAGLLSESRRRDRAVIESLAAAVEAKDTVTSRHLRQVARLAGQLAAQVDPELARREDFLFGCLLHDVGKIGVPEAILSKPGPLTEDEWIVMRRHPQTGARVVRPLGLSSTVVDIVLHHHERWDGSGYPSGLCDEQIPLVARIFSVCDALEAMTATRPYRAPLPSAIAFERVRIEAGRQFDPAIVQALERGVASGAIDLDDPSGVESAPAPRGRFARGGLVGSQG